MGAIRADAESQADILNSEAYIMSDAEKTIKIMR
jgi:hypothetical protein